MCTRTFARLLVPPAAAELEGIQDREVKADGFNERTQNSADS